MVNGVRGNSNVVYAPEAHGLSLSQLVDLVNGDKVKEAVQGVQQVPREQLSSFLASYPIENPKTEALIQALLEEKQIEATLFLVTLAFDKKPDWWKDNAKLHASLLEKAVQQHEKPLAELIGAQGVIQGYSCISFVKAAIEAHFDSILLFILPKVIMKMTDDETFSCLESIIERCSKPLFEQILEEFFHNEEFLHNKKARVVLTLLFRNGRFDLGTKYFRALEALSIRPRWMEEYDGPDECENGCFKSTWNTTLFIDICECMEDNAQFNTEGSAIATVLSKVIDPFAEGDKFFPEESMHCSDRIRPLFNPLRYAIQNKWTAIMQTFLQFSHYTQREEPQSLINPYADDHRLPTLFEYLSIERGEQFAVQFYADLDLQKNSTFEFLLELIIKEKNSATALELCERIETAQPVWWNVEVKANCFRLALDENNKAVADWFIDKIPNDYDMLKGLWEYSWSAEVMGVKYGQVDVGNAAYFGHEDIVEKLCQKKIDCFLEQILADTQQDKLQEQLFDLIDIGAERTEDSSLTDDQVVAVHRTFENSSLDWLKTYNAVWKHLRAEEPEEAESVLRAEFLKEKPEKWVEDNKRIKNILNIAVQKGYQDIAALCVTCMNEGNKLAKRFFCAIKRGENNTAKEIVECMRAVGSSLTELNEQNKSVFSLVHENFVDQAQDFIECCSLQQDRSSLLKSLIKDNYADLAALFFSRLHSLSPKPAWWTSQVRTELFFLVAPQAKKNAKLKEIALALFHDPLLDMSTKPQGNALLIAIQEQFEDSEIIQLLKTRFSIQATKTVYDALVAQVRGKTISLPLKWSLCALCGDYVELCALLTRVSFAQRYALIRAVMRFGLLSEQYEKVLVEQAFSIDRRQFMVSPLSHTIAPPAGGVTLSVLQELDAQFGTVKDVAAINLFIQKIASKVADVSAPSAVGVREMFYKNIQNQLLHVLSYFKKEVEAIEVSHKKGLVEVAQTDSSASILLKNIKKFLKESAEAGDYCSTRIQDHVRSWYLQCILKQQDDFSTRLHHELAVYRSIIVEEAVPHEEQNVHIHNGFLYTYERLFALPGCESVADDKFTEGHEEQIEAIRDHFEKTYVSRNIIEFVRCVLKDNRDFFVDFLRTLQSRERKELEAFLVQDFMHRRIYPIWDDKAKSIEQKRKEIIALMETAPGYFDVNEKDAESLETIEAALIRPENGNRLLHVVCEKDGEITWVGVVLALIELKVLM